MAPRTTGELATSSCVLMAPITSALPFLSMPRNSATRAKSISTGGLARRCFMVGISVWPPASSLASLVPASSLAASASDCGR